MNSHVDLRSRNRVIPRLELLEDRCLPAPAMGGVAVQVGSTLDISVGPADVGPVVTAFGSTMILEDGMGNVAAAWDGMPFQFFRGVNTVNFDAGAPVNLVSFFNLGALQQTAFQLNLNMQGVANAFFEHLPAATQLQNALVSASLNTLSQQLQPLLGTPLPVTSTPPVPTFPS